MKMGLNTTTIQAFGPHHISSIPYIWVKFFLRTCWEFLHEADGMRFYKMPVRYGTKLVEGSVPTTCEMFGLSDVEKQTYQLFVKMGLYML